MNAKWAGAVLVIIGCGGYGFSLAAAHKNQEQIFHQLIAALEDSVRELEFRLTTLPDLCRHASGNRKGIVKSVFLRLAEELEQQVQPDVPACMEIVLSAFPELSPKVRNIFDELGHGLGRFDLPGQVQSLESLIHLCRKELESLEKDRDARLRSYRTLSLSAGTALAILFL